MHLCVMVKNAWYLFFILLYSINSFAQPRTMGLTQWDKDYADGYVLFTPLSSKNTYLIDACGKKVHTWTSTYTSGTFQTLLNDGSLLRAGLVAPPRFGLGSGGVIEKFDWDGNVTWTFKIADSNQYLHHDFHIMPNGHILAIVWERKTPAEAIAHGRDPNLSTPSVWSERIIEIEPFYEDDSAEIVWEWSAWDHVIQDYDNTKPNYGVVANYPQRLNLNYTGDNYQDWLHINSVSYNAALDQIIVSAHSTSEIFILDHSTNVIQSAGHSGGTYGKGGDLLYRWGNPAAYNRGTPADQRLFRQHHAHWIPTGFDNAGKIMVFNNGWGRQSGNYSSIDIIEPPTSAPGVYSLLSSQPYGPVSGVEYYKNPTPSKFYSQVLSGAYSLPDGGLFITAGTSGNLFRIDKNKNIVWNYINPVDQNGAGKQGTTPGNNMVFRAEFYDANFAGFEGKNLSATEEIESSPVKPALCEVSNQTEAIQNPGTHLYPNPAEDIVVISGAVAERATLFSADGRKLKEFENTSVMDLKSLAPGCYRVIVVHDASVQQHTLLKQ